MKFKQSSRAARLLKRGACCVLATSLCFVGPGAYGLTAWADPAGGDDGGADASDAAKTVNFGADVLTTPADGWTASEGNYLYFGTHDGYVDDGEGQYSSKNDRDAISPTKYRVLSNVDGKVLLDSDELLWVDQYKKKYYKEPRTYADSDVRAYLKDAKTLTAVTSSTADTPAVPGDDNTSLFSDQELQSIESTNLSAKDNYNCEGMQTGAYYYDTATTGDKAFLLSADEVATYYASLTDAEKSFAYEENSDYWMTWLRSKVDTSAQDGSQSPHLAGVVYGTNWLYDIMDADYGIAPAAYLNTDNVLFTTDNSFDKTQALAQVKTADTQTWKATLQQGGDFHLGDGTIDENGVVTMSYTYEDSQVEASQISLLIASGDLDDGGEILYYGKAGEAPTAETGTFSFTLPDGLPDTYKAYAFAEDVNGEGYTDYATTPADFSWGCTVSFDTLDGSDPDEAKVNNGATVTKPSDPVREGYSFGGWYTDENCTAGNEYDFNTPVNKSFTLYAKWIAPGWERLAGNTAIGTMKQIVNEGWDASEFAIVATNKSYHDALAASGLAGLLEAPVLLTAQDSLTPATKALIEAKGVEHVVVVGGTEAISDAVLNQIKAIDGVSAERVWGNTAIGTANKIYDYGKTLVASGAISEGWGKDAVVATTNSYHDAASIAPYAYAQHAPVFLVGDTLSDGTAKRVVDAGAFDRTLVIGGTVAVSADVEGQLVNPTRLGGNTAYGTCKKVADFCLANGMTAAHMGVATGRSYQDAIVGAALCGKNNSILVLADDGNSANVNSVVAAHKAEMVGSSYIFGGTQAISAAVEKKIVDATK